ncbi:MAG: polymer-forming cytoskeletal protein [Lachnospiraceae bacterium]|nr:polymer-forming cytoskeletal protein [Lachnospiraceae bacterium]MBQ7864497.1 polymer-forming cytoskeletal protein [Lachnospiraceae bacterium]MBQ8632312.1 polymer-forming cytoskeletal protein [Lachnospiraceae bacterium]
MSLFKDITDELEQAVNDIEVEQTEEDEDLFAILSEGDDVEVDQDLLNSMLEDEELTEETAADIEPEEVKEEPVVENTQGETVAEEAPVVKEEPKREVSEEDKNAVTVITKGTTINGSIISDCSLDVMGTINGDIECLGKLTISGKVTGNSLASEVVVNTDRLEGSVVSEGAVKVGLGTVVIGDITAASAVFAGAVKGEIDVKGPVVLDSTAIIKGNIKAKSIQMANGAVMDGFCSLSYADLKIDDIFE